MPKSKSHTTHCLAEGHYKFYPNVRPSGEILSINFDHIETASGTENFLRKLTKAERTHFAPEKGPTVLPADHIRIHRYHGQHGVDIVGKANIETIVNWARQHNAAVQEKLVKAKIPGADIPWEESSRVVPAPKSHRRSVRPKAAHINIVITEPTTQFSTLVEPRRNMSQAELLKIESGGTPNGFDNVLWNEKGNSR